MTTESMVVANDQTLIEMINGATRRLVFMAPGMSLPVAGAIAHRYRALPHEWVTVITDVDPEVCRLGYGNLAALEQLEEIGRKEGGMILRQPGVRIGLVIADDQTLVFAPTPQLIEASPDSKEERTNAIRIGLPPADLERDLGLGADGITSRVIGLDKASVATIRKARADLDSNPPQRFDISRTVRVFNAQFEFVELKMTGAALDRRRIQIPAELFGLDESKNPLAKSLRMAVTLDGIPILDPVSRLHRAKNWIMSKHLKYIPGYGHIVLRNDKDAFLAAVNRLRILAKRRETEMRVNLEAALLERREALARMLLPTLKQEPPGHRQRELFWSTEKWLNRELKAIFSKTLNSIEPIKVSTIFKAVTYESLTDETFMSQVAMQFPNLKLFEEFDAAAGQKTEPTETGVTQ